MNHICIQSVFLTTEHQEVPSEFAKLNESAESFHIPPYQAKSLIINITH